MRIAFVLAVLALGACKRHPARPTIIEGTIESLELVRGHAPIVSLHVPGFATVHCHFPENRFDELSKLQPGQSLRVRGTVVPESGGFAVENTAIEFAGRKPGEDDDDD